MTTSPGTRSGPRHAPSPSPSGPRPADHRSDEPWQAEQWSTDPRLAEQRAAEPRQPEPRQPEARLAEQRQPEQRSAERRPAEHRSTESRSTEPRSNESRSTEPRPPMPRQPSSAQQAPAQPDPVTVEAPAPRDSRPVLVLRITAYVLTSLASLVFLALVVWGYLGIQDLKQRLASSPVFGGTPSYSAPAVPGSFPSTGDPGTAPTGDPGTGDQFANVCRDNPTAPECNGTAGG